MSFADLARLLRAVVTMAESPSVGNGVALFVATVEAILPLLPSEQLRAELDDAARRRADAIGDAALRTKFGA